MRCESNGVLMNRLEDLAECGFIRKYLSVGGVNGGIYQLIDNFTLFYMRFVRGSTSRDGDHWTDGVSQGEKNEWRGFAFERLCLEHTAQIKRALGISGVRTDVNLKGSQQQIVVGVSVALGVIGVRPSGQRH